MAANYIIVQTQLNFIRMDLEKYLTVWGLQRDGELLTTHSSHLLPVLYEGRQAMLKVAVENDEKLGNEVMVWWNGNGAAHVLRHDEEALLMERATGTGSLSGMSRSGNDDVAVEILCATAKRLHSIDQPPPDGMIPMERWFRDLFLHGEKYGGVIAEGLRLARRLVVEEVEKCVLHGDLHHDNVLDFGEKGWLAIDPKKLYGDRAFDYANIFCNPDQAIAGDTGIFLERLQYISTTAGINRHRLLEWVLAWAGLSAVWFLEDNMKADIDLAVGAMALAELNK